MHDQLGSWVGDIIAGIMLILGILRLGRRYRDKRSMPVSALQGMRDRAHASRYRRSGVRLGAKPRHGTVRRPFDLGFQLSLRGSLYIIMSFRLGGVGRWSTGETSHCRFKDNVNAGLSARYRIGVAEGTARTTQPWLSSVACSLRSARCMKMSI